MMAGQESLTVVVGYDGSQSARHALTRLQRFGGQELTVVILAVTSTVPSPGLGVELTGQQLESDAVLREARELLQTGGGIRAIDTRSATGDPAEVLISTAREFGADLLVVGRSGRDYVSRTLLGSVAARVVQYAPCDVLVVS